MQLIFIWSVKAAAWKTCKPNASLSLAPMSIAGLNGCGTSHSLSLLPSVIHTHLPKGSHPDIPCRNDCHLNEISSHLQPILFIPSSLYLFFSAYSVCSVVLVLNVFLLIPFVPLSLYLFFSAYSVCSVVLVFYFLPLIPFVPLFY